MQVETRQGLLNGGVHDGVLSFLNIPYAEFNGRFQKAASPKPYDGVRDATKAGPVFSQTKGRLSFVMGTTEEEKNCSEDAFRLNIWAPDAASPQELAGRKLPVIIFMHGGAWVTGGGSIPWYYGDEIVRKSVQLGTPAVFVNLNYRLGVFGSAYFPGTAEPNCTYKDVLMAMDWIRENIAAFGGDPDSLHVGGQSAGAWYTVAMMANPKFSRGLRSASLFSLPANDPPKSVERMQAMMNEVLKAAGPGADGETLKNMDTADLLKIQMAAAKVPSTDLCVYMPMVEEGMIPSDIYTAAVQNAPKEMRIFANNNRQEYAAFLAGNAEEMGSGYLAEVKRLSDRTFVTPTNQFVFALEKAGQKVLNYSFPYESKQPNVYGCHCFDVPFLFGTFDAWSNAPFLQNIDAEEARSIGDAYRELWLKFILG